MCSSGRAPRNSPRPQHRSKPSYIAPPWRGILCLLSCLPSLHTDDGRVVEPLFCSGVNISFELPTLSARRSPSEANRAKDVKVERVSAASTGETGNVARHRVALQLVAATGGVTSIAVQAPLGRRSMKDSPCAFSETRGDRDAPDG
jgi:hypothetical protein